jgi:uncharacterized membrane protein
MFSIKESIVFGWHKLKSHSGLVFQVVLTMFALQVVSSVVQKSLEGTATGTAASIVLAVLGVILGAGMTLIFLKLGRGEHAHYREIWPELSLAWKYFCASLLTGVITFLPLMVAGVVDLVLLSATGSINFSEGAPAEGSGAMLALAAAIALAGLAGALYLGLRYSMARLAVIDGAPIVESLRRSRKLTEGVKWRLVLFALAIAALNLLGFIALVVGLLVTIPISLLAFVHVYLKLKSHHGHH